MRDSKNKILILISLLVLTFSLVSVSYSWFLISNSVDIDLDSSLTVASRNDLLISLDNGVTWSGSYSTGTSFGTVLDVSGNGVNLYTPIAFTGALNDIPTNFDTATPIYFTSPNSDGDYLELKIMFRSQAPLTVLFGGDSAINPVSSDANVRRSTFGSFTLDNIAGAARLAILNSSKDETIMIWAPNPYFQLTYSGDATAEFTKNGTIEPAYYYYSYDGISYTKQTVSKNAYYTRDYIVGSTSTTSGEQGSSKVLLSLNKENESDVYYTGTLNVRIWIEGTDRESQIPLSGGKVSMSLVFIGSSKTVNETWENNISYIENNGSLDGTADYTGLYINRLSTSGDLTSWEAYNTSLLINGKTYVVYYAGNESYLDSSITYFTYTG